MNILNWVLSVALLAVLIGCAVMVSMVALDMEASGAVFNQYDIDYGQHTK